MSPQRPAVGTTVVESGGSPCGGVWHRAADPAGVGHSGARQADGEEPCAGASATGTSQGTGGRQRFSPLAADASLGKAFVLA